MKEVVKYDNTINSLKFNNFTKLDMNFFFACISKMYDKGAEEVKLSFQEIKQAVHYTSTNRSDFIRDIERMYKKLDSIIYRYEDEECIEMFHIFQKFKCVKTKDEIQIKVAEEFVPLINDLKKNFTYFELEKYVSLDSKYSKRMFTILKQWKNNGETKSFENDELQELFDCKSYTTKNFLNLVLKPCIKELNEKEYFDNLEIIVERDSSKRGRPIKSYKFTFDKQGKKSDEKQTIKSNQDRTCKKTETKQKINPNNKFNNFEQRDYSKDKIAEMQDFLSKKAVGNL